MNSLRGPYAVLIRMAAIWALVFNLVAAGWMTGAHAAAYDPFGGAFTICTADGAMQAPADGEKAPVAPGGDCRLCAALHSLLTPVTPSATAISWRVLAQVEAIELDAQAQPCLGQPHNRGPPIR